MTPWIIIGVLWLIFLLVTGLWRDIFLGILIVFVGIPLSIAARVGFWNGVDGWLDRRMQ